MKTRLAVLAAIAITASAAPAAAESRHFDLKLGVRGGTQFPILLKPGDAGDYKDVPYTNYWGAGWTAGGALGFRFWGLGLETGVLYAPETVKGTIELDKVKIPNPSTGTLQKQEIDQEISRNAIHLPVVAQLVIPLGFANFNVSAGADFILHRSEQKYRPVERDRIPDPSDPNYAIWAADPEYQAVANATIASDDSLQAGAILGLGFAITGGNFEIPLEIRTTYYPTTGSQLSQRGDFRQQPLQYNDQPNFQVMILVGFDYLFL